MEDARDVKQTLRGSHFFSCCFYTGKAKRVEEDEQLGCIRATCSWLKSKAQEIPEIKVKCKNIICLIGKGRRTSGNFRYDSFTHSLNFDEGVYDSDMEDIQYGNFSSRLPASPPTGVMPLSEQTILN